MRIIVTGGNGFIGSHLVEALLAQGHEVCCPVRPTADLRWIATSGAEIIPGALDHPDSTRDLLASADHVYHLAGATRAGSAAEFMAVNRGLTLSLLEACAAAPAPPRFVYLSSLAAAGPSEPGAAVTEEMPPRPVSRYGRSKRAAEEAVEAFAGRVPSVIVRPPVVYGPRDAALLSAFRIVRWRVRPSLGGGRRLSFIYIDDLIAGLLCVMNAAPGTTYFMTHPEALSMGEFGKAITRAMGVRALPIPIPDPLVRIGGGLSELTAFMYAGMPPFNRDKALEMMQPGWVCDGTRAWMDFGFRPTRPHEEALEATASWYREAGWL